MNTASSLVVVLTAGAQVNGGLMSQGLPLHRGQPWAADLVGTERLTSAGIYLSQNESSGVVVVGGQLPDYALAEIYFNQLRFTYKGLREKVMNPVMSGRCTVDDMIGLAKLVFDQKLDERFDGLVLISHPDHTRLAKITLLAKLKEYNVRIKIEERNSCEDPPYSFLKKTILNYVTSRDPFWQGFLGQRLRAQANKRHL